MQADESPSVFGGIVDGTALLEAVRDTPSYQWHDDDERFDRVEIEVVPRYKTSGMSGDEWRVSARLTFYYKGRVAFQRSFGNMETACKALGWFEAAREYWNVDAFKDREELCFQPSCPERATVEYAMKKTYDKHHGEVIYNNEEKRKTPHGWIYDYRVRFCERHERRGDCGLNDADENYFKTAVRGAAGWEPV